VTIRSYFYLEVMFIQKIVCIRDCVSQCWTCK